MLLGEVQNVHLVPRGVQDLLPYAAAAGLSPGATEGAPSHAWVLHQQALLVWRVEDGPHASVRRLQLPAPVGGRIFVQILSRGPAGPLTVVACTSAGLLAVWLDAQLLGAPYTQQLAVHAAPPTAAENEDGEGSAQQEVVCAMAAHAADSASTGAGFVAVISAADGSLHLYHGSARGVFPRQFYRPAGVASSADGRGARRRSSGLLGALGSALQSAYSEAFDPLHKLQRRGASTMPALALALQPLTGAGPGGRWRLLVLTQEALDCWLVGAAGGRAAAEEHVWSYNLHGVLSSDLHASELQVLTFAASPDGSSVFVWSAAQTPGSVSRTHALSRLALKPDMIPFLEGSVAVTGLELPDPEPQEQPRGWQLAAHVKHSSCVACAPNGAAVAWVPEAGAPRPLVSPGAALAVGCSAMSGLWQVFSAQLGVLEMDAEAQEGAEVHEDGDAMQGTAAGAHDSSDSIMALLDTTVSLMALEHSAGAPYAELAHGLSGRLARLGAFDGPGVGEVLLRLSAGILDQMGQSGAPGPASAVSLRDQLASKQLRHDLYLAALSQGGVLQRVAPQHLHELLQHAQQLEAVASVVTSQEAAGAADEGQGLGQAVVSGAQGALGAVVRALEVAGDATRTASDQALPSWELFFARPSQTAVLLFDAVAQQAATVREQLDAEDRSGTTTNAARQLLGLALLLDNARKAAVEKQQGLEAQFGIDGELPEASGGSWLVTDRTRDAWAQLCQACLALKPRLSADTHVRLQLSEGAHLPATTALLAAYVQSVAHAVDPQRSQLLEEYHGARAANVGGLVEDAALQLDELRARGLTSTATPGSNTLVWRTQALAVQHHCYPQIMAIYQLLQQHRLAKDSDLHHLMQTLPGEPGAAPGASSLAQFVFEQLRRAGNVKELLGLGRLGLEGQLRQYLAAHPQLLWMGELQGGAFDRAAGTLVGVGQAEQGTVQQRRRMLCLAKLSAVASAQPALRHTADAELQLLGIQERLGLQHQAPMDADELAEAALGTASEQQQRQHEQQQGGGVQEALLLAVEALSLAPADVRKKSRALWERAWAAVLGATGMASLVQLRQGQYRGEAGAQDYNAGVQSSLLCRAMAACGAALRQDPSPQAAQEASAVLENVRQRLLQLVGNDQERTAIVQDAAVLASQQLNAWTSAAA